MKSLKKLSKKKKIVLIIVIIILIIIARNILKTKNIEENKIEIEVIEKRNIAQSVAATGTITTEKSKDIVSTLTGSEIKTVDVVEGQKVSVGDVICTFDMSSTKNNLSDAKSTANISNAQSNLGIESAQRNLNDAMKNRDSQIVSAQKEVESANQAYQNVQNQINAINAQIAEKQAQIANLNNSISQLQASNVPSQNMQVSNEVPEATVLSQEEINAQSAKFNNQIQVLTAEISQLQACLPELQQSANQLKTALDISISTLNTTSTTADSTVASMRDNLKSAELSASANSQTQKSQIRAYEEQLEKGIVTSNVNGTVTSVNVKQGDIYTGSTIAKIDGTEEFIIEAEIDEYYIPDIKVGMNVLIKTDATRDEELTGKVIFTAVSPTTSSINGVATTSNANTTYNVKIALDNQNERLRLGMNAKISIILDSKENVWTVPYDAVYEREEGTRYIEILKNEETQEKEELDVTVGIEGTYYIEVYSDKLVDGMKVVLPEREAENSIEELINAMGADAGM